MKFGVVVFPGSNCDADTLYAFREVMGQPAVFLWHKDHDLHGADVVILPCGPSAADAWALAYIEEMAELENTQSAHEKDEVRDQSHGPDWREGSLATKPSGSKEG